MSAQDPPRQHTRTEGMTDLQTREQALAAAANLAISYSERRQARKLADGFELDAWGDDGDILGTFGHIDIDRFRDHLRWFLRHCWCLEEDEAAQWDRLPIEHRYVLTEVDQWAETVFRWAVPDETKVGHAQLRDVHAGDPGSVAVTIVDAS